MPKTSTATKIRTVPNTPVSVKPRRPRREPPVPTETDPSELDALPWEELWALAIETLHENRRKGHRKNGPTV